MRPRVLKAIAATMFREYWRTPEAIFWTYCFPILMAVALGVAFGSDEKAPLPIVVEESTGQDGSGDEPWLVKLRQDPRLSVETAPNAEAAEGYRRGRYLAWIQREEGRPRIVVDPARPDTELVRLVVARALAPPRAEGLRVVTLNAPGSRYIDWLIPGLIGLNLLGAGLWGIGFNLVQMRIGNTLRRLMVTPMGRAEFLLAFMLSRLVLVVPEAAVIILFGHLAFGVPITLSSTPLLLLIVVLSAMSFQSLGILVGSRARSVEAVSGLMNLVMLPMWVLSGSFFSSERFPDVMQPAVRALPLTQVNDGLREVFLQGESLTALPGNLAYLVGFTLVCFTLAMRWFRWT